MRPASIADSESVRSWAGSAKYVWAAASTP